MSKDMLGSVVRAAIGVPQNRCDLLARIANDLSRDNPRGDEWYAFYEEMRTQGLPLNTGKWNLIYTRPISDGHELVLPPNDGTQTIAQASNVFTYIDPDFKNWGLDVTSTSTPPLSVVVREMIKDADFRTIFGEIGDTARLCLTQGQIIDFVRFHKGWLRTDGYGTFFLFQKGDKMFVSLDDFYVAYVFSSSGGRLWVHVYRLLHAYVWLAGSRHRIVVPQLML
ncbi:MAG: hypothetical protein AAB545_02410 [Patescibacteria group bacterium]